MRESGLPERVTQFLARHQLGGAPLAVALSGGIDSMVLLDVLAALPRQAAEAGPLLSAIHINHRLSANADAWAGFCRAQCAQRGVPLTVVAVEVERHAGGGLEAAARSARYAALAHSGAPFILTAQHRDDQAETVLHQMLRGTGLNGLAGMGERRALPAAGRPGQLLLRPLLLRPFLEAGRGEIEAYAAQRQLAWIEDESNADTAFTRNFIRHQLLPLVATRFPHYADSLARVARHAADSAELLDALASLDLAWNGHEAHAGKLDALPPARQVNALYHWLRWRKVAPPSHAQLEDWAAQLFRKPPSGKPQQAGGHGFVIRRRQNRLLLLRRDAGSGAGSGAGLETGSGAGSEAGGEPPADAPSR